MRPVQFLDPASHRGQRVDNTDGLGLTMLISCNKIGNIPRLIGIVSNLNGTDWIFVTFQSKPDQF